MERQKSQTFSVQYLKEAGESQSAKKLIFVVPLKCIFQVGGQPANMNIQQINNQFSSLESSNIKIFEHFGLGIPQAVHAM